MVIIGGGVIGTEFATIFNSLGTKVAVIEMMPQLIPGEDRELAVNLERTLKRAGIQVFTSARVTSIEDTPHESKTVIFSMAQGEQYAGDELVLVAVGRMPNSRELNLEAAGLHTQRDAIPVDEHIKTSVANIFAIGDVTGKVLLAHAASAQFFQTLENNISNISRLNLGLSVDG